MNHKIILSLFLLIPFGFSFADEASLTNTNAPEAATNTPYNLKIVIIPSPTQIHIHHWGGHSFGLLMSAPIPITLRIENPTSTIQDVRSYNSVFDFEHWKFSNPEVNYYSVQLGSKGNELVLDKIPPGGALTHEDEITVWNLPLLGLRSKIPFRMGFTPSDSTQTFWSNEVVLDVIYDDWPTPNDILMILSAILVMALILIWRIVGRVRQRQKLDAKMGQ